MQRIINWAVQRCLLVRHRWKRDNHVNNAMLNELVQWEPLETTIARQSLIWLGHVARMNIRRLPKQALFGFWQGHTARPNAPRGQAQWLRYLLAQIQQSELDWYRVAQNRDEWRQAILTEFPLPKIDHRQEILLNRWSPSTNQFPDYAGRFARQKRHRSRHLEKRADTGQFHCPVCGQPFPKANTLVAHYAAQHAVSNPEVITVATYTCSECNQVWRREIDRRQHICPVRPRPKRAPKAQPARPCRLCHAPICAANLERHEAGCRGPGAANRTCANPRCNAILGSVQARKNHEARCQL